MGVPPKKQDRKVKVRPQHDYEITLESGERYKITAVDEEQANTIAAAIQEQVTAGNPNLVDVQLPGNAIVHNDLPETTTGGAATRGLVRGGTLNFGDEISSFGNALGLAPIDNATGLAGDQQAFWNNPEGFWAAFDHNMRQQKDLYDADDEQHPVASGAGQVAGAVTTTLATGGPVTRGVGAVASRVIPKAAQRAAIPLVARAEAAALSAPVRAAVARGTAEGAGFGAVSGYGAGDTAENRAKSAATGLLTGGALGGAVSGTITGLAPAVKRYASVLFGRGNDREAVRQITMKLAEDGFDVTTPAGVQALRQELQTFTGKPVSLADIGSATRARAGVGLRSPSAAQQQSVDQVVARGQGQGARLAQDVRTNVAPRTDVHALDDALVEQRAQTALPLRDQALFEKQVTPPELPALPGPVVEGADEGLRRMLSETAPAVGPVKAMDDDFMAALAAKSAEPPVPAPAQPFGPPAPTIVPHAARMVDDDLLNQLASEHPLAQRALGSAVTLSQSERALKQMLGQPLDDVPEMLAGQPLDYRTADYLKRFLDDQVNRLARKADTETFKAAEYAQVRDLRNALRERMRATNEEYGKYLDSYSGSSEMIDALGEGRKYRALDPEEIAAGQGKRSTAAQELFRVGAARDMLDTINSTTDGRNPATRILNSPEARAQLEATGVAPEAAQRLNTAVGQERQLNLLNAEMAGSQTDARLAARADADAGISASVPFNPGSPFGWLGALGRSVTNRASLRSNAKVNEAALPRLLETDPAAIDRIITELEAGGQRMQAERLRRAAAASKTSRVLGTVIGSPVALQEGY